MPFFQNPFPTTKEIMGAWVLGDRQHSPSFTILANAGREDEVVTAYAAPPYDLSGNDLTGDAKASLKVAFSLRDERNWSVLSVDITAGAANAAAVTVDEIVAALTANATFNDFFQARFTTFKDGTSRVSIRQRRAITEFRFYVVNGQAEEALLFNYKAAVGEMPIYFARHAIENRFNYSDSQSCLVLLSREITGNTVANPTVVTSKNHGLKTGDIITVVNSDSTPSLNGDREVTVVDADTFSVTVNVSVAGTEGSWAKKSDAAVIANAVDFRGVALNYSLANVQADYQLLRGRSGIFQFVKQVVNANNQVLSKIEYPAGALAGDLGRKTTYTYTGTQTMPDTQAAIPYVIKATDLITP